MHRNLVDRREPFIPRRVEPPSRAVLLVIEQPAMHAALVRDVSSLKWPCISATTPAAVFQRLADPKLRFVAAIIDARHSHARSMLGFLARNHDSVRRVLLLSDRANDAMLADDVASDLVQAVLVSSWQRAALVAAVGVAGRR